jgi:aspartate 1-decarboxylase
MIRTMLQAKLHRVRVTHAILDYEGSCGIDRSLLQASGMQPNQYIEIYNVTNGERFTTYAMRAEAGSGIISINGAAAHRAKPGDVIIICAYCQLNAAEAINHKPRLIYLNEHNKVTRTSNAIPVQAA